jgi:hypothetical protein
VNVLLAVLLSGAAPMTVWAQQPSAQIPRFQDYPVTDVFKDKPAPPKLVSPGDRLFRTRITEGVSKGPSFAGHYTIAEWGCGSGCVSIALVDAQDGAIFKVPFSILGWGMPIFEYVGQYGAPNRDGFMPLSYRLDSRLLIVRGCPEDENCATYFYEWKSSQFKLIRKIVAAPVHH